VAARRPSQHSPRPVVIVVVHLRLGRRRSRSAAVGGRSAAVSAGSRRRRRRRVRRWRRRGAPVRRRDVVVVVRAAPAARRGAAGRQRGVQRRNDGQVQRVRSTAGSRLSTAQVSLLQQDFDVVMLRQRNAEQLMKLSAKRIYVLI